MLTYDVDLAGEAVQYLVCTPYFARIVRKLRTYVKRPRATPFTGDAAALNELLKVGRQNYQAMENMIAVAEFKRETINDKQRQLMAQRRWREKMVGKIEAALRKEPLTKQELENHVKAAYASWNADRDAWIEAQIKDFTTRNGRKPTITETSEIISVFWAGVDAELEEQLAVAVKTSGVKRKQPTLVVVKKPEPKTVMASAFRKVMARKDDLEKKT